MVRPRVFISYTRVEPDESIARQLYQTLGDRCEVFIDQAMRPGDWSNQLEEALRSADWFVVLLSKTSAYKEGVRSEVDFASMLHKLGGKPIIVPVRINYQEGLPMRLYMTLQHLQFLTWSGTREADTAALAKWILDGNRDLGSRTPQRPVALRLVRQARAGNLGSLVNAMGFRSVSAVSIVRDGSRALSAVDKSVHVWDSRTGTELFDLGPFPKRVNCLASTPDGRLAVTGSVDGQLKVWNLQTGAEVWHFEPVSTPIVQVALASSGTLAVGVGADQGVTVWDLERWKVLHTMRGHTDRVTAIQFACNDSQLLSLSGSSLCVWDIVSGQRLHTMRVPSGYYEFEHAVPLKGNELSLLVGGTRRLGIIRLRDGTEESVIENSCGLIKDSRITYTADGQRFVYSSGPRSVIVRDAKNWTEVLTAYVQADRVLPLLRDGSALLTVQSSTFQLWRSPTYEENETYTKSHPGGPGYPVAIQLADLSLKNGISDFAISEDGCCAIAGDYENMLHFLAVEYAAV